MGKKTVYFVCTRNQIRLCRLILFLSFLCTISASLTLFLCTALTDKTHPQSCEICGLFYDLYTTYETGSKLFLCGIHDCCTEQIAVLRRRFVSFTISADQAFLEALVDTATLKKTFAGHENQVELDLNCHFVFTAYKN